MKTISNRKAKQFSQPWITKDIRIFIKVKNKLYASSDTANYAFKCDVDNLFSSFYNKFNKLITV